MTTSLTKETTTTMLMFKLAKEHLLPSNYTAYKKHFGRERGGGGRERERGREGEREGERGGREGGKERERGREREGGRERGREGGGGSKEGCMGQLCVYNIRQEASASRDYQITHRNFMLSLSPQTQKPCTTILHQIGPNTNSPNPQEQIME